MVYFDWCSPCRLTKNRKNLNVRVFSKGLKTFVLVCFFGVIAEPALPPPPSESSNDKQIRVRPSSSYKDYMSLANYNTAPRGWHKGDAAFYRPVTFGVSRPGAVRRADVDARRKSFTDF